MHNISNELARLENTLDLTMPHINDHPAEACSFLLWLLVDGEQGVVQYADETDRPGVLAMASMYARCLEDDTPSWAEWEVARGDVCTGEGPKRVARAAGLGNVKEAARAAARMAYEMAYDKGDDPLRAEEARYATRVEQHLVCTELMSGHRSYYDPVLIANAFAPSETGHSVQSG